ncbi:MAG: hypothetical protein IT446_15480 [Phycisphaerales bacterium]|nr:hypothetical protein [Phycisphaerales bacterium]
MKELNLQIRSAGPGAWRARLVGNGGKTRDLLLESDEQVGLPEALDGLAAAVLPLAMRGGFDVLRVHGPITHGALWRLLEYARIWHLWSPEKFHSSRIEAQRVLNGQAPDAKAPALVAWSGSVLSAHTLVRMVERRAAGAPVVGGVVRISGLRPGDEAGIDKSRRAIESMGLRFHHVRTNALKMGLVDPAAGRLAMVCGAMHLLSRQYGCGIHARGYPLASQMIFPRPGPALPDLFSGDGFAIRADGGEFPLSVVARELTRYPALAGLALASISRRPRSERMLIRLAFRAAGKWGETDGWRDLLDAMLIPMDSGSVTCEAKGICDHWKDPRDGVRRVLSARLRMGQMIDLARDYGRWVLAMVGLRGVYPR